MVRPSGGLEVDDELELGSGQVSIKIGNRLMDNLDNLVGSLRARLDTVTKEHEELRASNDDLRAKVIKLKEEIDGYKRTIAGINVIATATGTAGDPRKPSSGLE
jgi:hypothetical protein